MQKLERIQEGPLVFLRGGLFCLHLVWYGMVPWDVMVGRVLYSHYGIAANIRHVSTYYSVSSVLYSVSCILFSVSSVLYSVWCILYSVLCIIFSVFWIMYYVLCTLYSVFCTLYPVSCTLSPLLCVRWLCNEVTSSSHSMAHSMALTLRHRDFTPAKLGLCAKLIQF